jgi:hypothetical protein
MSIRYLLVTRTVRNESVNNNLLPLSVFEELEDGETLIYSVVHNQVLEQLRLVSEKHK